jgi:hypothetical protein
LKENPKVILKRQSKQEKQQALVLKGRPELAAMLSVTLTAANWPYLLLHTSLSVSL